MKRFKKILFLALMVAALSCLFCQPAFAISEEEVQAQVDAVGKETVSGSVRIWFMCAILPPFRSRTPFRLSDLTARSTVDVPTFIDSASSAIVAFGWALIYSMSRSSFGLRWCGIKKLTA